MSSGAFGRHAGRGPDHDSRGRQGWAAIGDGRAQVGEHDMIPRAEQDVARFHVPVQDTDRVRRPDRVENLQSGPRARSGRSGPSACTTSPSDG